MVKSRADIGFPHLKDNATESDKNLWELEWKKIIKEYESMLRSYIARDFID
jgi:aminoglycoside/choline kinase family phosphotransferase